MRPHHRQQIFAFAVLLFLQFAAGPACCLMVPAFAEHPAVGSAQVERTISHPHSHAGTHGNSFLAADHLCAAGHGLNHAAILTDVLSVGPLVVWQIFPAPFRMMLPPSRSASANPRQARAPPIFF